MARRKNVKRIDPRYFLDETANRNDDGSALEDIQITNASFCKKKSKGEVDEAVVGKPLTKGRLQPRAGHEPPDLAFKRATGYKNCEDLKAAWGRAADEFHKVHSDPRHQMSMAYPQLQDEADRLDALMKEHCSDVLQKDAAAWDAWSTAEDEKQRGRDVRRAAEKYYTDMAEGNKTSLTLDEAKDIARKIFERIRKESK